MIIQMDIKRARNSSTEKESREKESREKELADIYEACKRLDSSQRAIVRRETIRMLNQSKRSTKANQNITNNGEVMAEDSQKASGKVLQHPTRLIKTKANKEL